MVKYLMFVIFSLFMVEVSFAHRTVECDGKKVVDIRLDRQGIIQIRSTEKITGVYPAREQVEGFIEYDDGRPKHIFRIDASVMEGDRVGIHLNTLKHTCFIRVWKVKSKIDTTVTVNFPPNEMAAQFRLPPDLRESPARQMWWKQWVVDKKSGPPTVKVTPVTGEVKRFVKGIDANLKWRYTMPGYIGFTILLKNTLLHPERIPIDRLKDAMGSIYTTSMTETLGDRPWPYHWILQSGEEAFLHVVYEIKGERNG